MSASFCLPCRAQQGQMPQVTYAGQVSCTGCYKPIFTATSLVRSRAVFRFWICLPIQTEDFWARTPDSWGALHSILLGTLWMASDLVAC